LVLALCHKLGIDRAAADTMLEEHEKKLESDRLVKIEDHNPSIAALASSFLERWDQDTKGSSSEDS
jgi:hypothetical protein